MDASLGHTLYRIWILSIYIIKRFKVLLFKNKCERYLKNVYTYGERYIEP
jgi:hypothetical protein